MTRAAAASLNSGFLSIALLGLSLQQQGPLAKLQKWSRSDARPVGEISRSQALEQARSLWKAAGIENYVITVMTFRGFLHTESHTITVKGGQVVGDHSYCASAPLEIGGCKVEHDTAGRYSVDGLLAGGEQFADAKYDPALGIPLEASYDEPTTMAGQQGFWVEKFEPTPPADGR
jgi:hypothetical protein